MSTTRPPRLTIGLPVRNGADYVEGALDALLGQTFEDFALIISDNASTDATEEICRDYAARDDRIRYIRQDHNIGALPNHNVVFDMSRSELFKWASHDDLYARDLIERCVAALDEHPEVVLAHSWTAVIDETGTVTSAVEYPLATSSPSAPVRFRSMLRDDGGDDDYGVIRSAVLRSVPPHGSYHRSDRTIMAELTLRGPFHQVPDWLYFRRHHVMSLEGSALTIREKCTAWDPRRADRWRHPVARLLAEYVWAYVTAIGRSPLSAADRAACYRELGRWMADRVVRRTVHRDAPGPWSSMVPAAGPAPGGTPEAVARVGAVAQVVAGRGRDAAWEDRA